MGRGERARVAQRSFLPICGRRWERVPSSLFVATKATDDAQQKEPRCLNTHFF